MDELNVVVETTQYIVIKIGEEQYGIDIQNIDNILRMPKITRVPKVAPYMKGVINLRGEVIPVMSLRRKMGLEEGEPLKTNRIIILKVENQEAIGVIVDEVKEVVTLEETQIDKVSYETREENNFISGVGKCGEGLISLLDLTSVIPEVS